MTQLNERFARFVCDGTPHAVVARYLSLEEAAARADFGEFDTNIVVLDTETTGLSFNHDELTQIAAARLEKGQIVDRFNIFVNPGKPIPDEVVHLTNITDEMVADAPMPAEALAQLVEFVGDAKIVAHNVEFDKNFTTRHPAGYPLLENTWIDSLDLARIALPRMKSHRLIDLAEAYDSPRSTHRADDDVNATCVMLRILLAAVDAMPYQLVNHIANLATEEEWSTSAVFKYFAARKQGPEDERILFSLRALRRARLGTSEFRAKHDAAALAENPELGLTFPTEADIADAFAENGLVGQLYPDYEARQEQVIMSKGVTTAFTQSQNLMVEAGTGVGKSMAYLVPAALASCENDITIGIATKTNALLDQLVHHELPALAKAFARDGKQLTFASLKGFSHYPCLRRVERIASEGVSMKMLGNKEYSPAPALAALLSFIEQTEYDDTDGLKIDYRLLPRRSITTTSHECLRKKCPFYGVSCFVHGSRRRAEASNVVVTNHSLLFCDLAADGGLLPPIRYWVVDEAHGAENEARRAFSLELVSEEINHLAHRVSADESSRNVFARAERTVVIPGQEDAATLFYALTNKAKTAGKSFAEAATDFTHHMRDLLYFDTTRKNKGYEVVELWLNDDIRASETYRGVAGFGKIMVERAEKLITACQELVGYLEDADGSAAVIQREIASIAIELKELVNAADIILFKGPDQYVYATTLSKRGERPVDKLEAMPFSVGSILAETLYARTHAVVFASATLTVGDSFESFEASLGLNEDEESRASALMLGSSYDFNNQMTIYVANDIPEPNDPRYLADLQTLLAKAHLAQDGSMLTLFTNRKEMEKCFDAVNPELKAAGLRLVCQKWGVSVKGLRDDFIEDEHLSLFALKSFWEGFDAPGATLKGVIIPKLPFAKPTDPLSCERSCRDDQAWRRYVLPAAVLETKQAAGRLIRKADDLGVLILADRRLVTKGYGKSFLRSMPSNNIIICSMAEIIAALEQGR